MYTAVYCNLTVWPSGEVTAHLYTTEDARRNGVLHADHRWTACPPGDGTGDTPAPVSVALGCATLGSRLLRLASEIHAQQPLFHVHGLDGGAA